MAVEIATINVECIEELRRLFKMLDKAMAVHFAPNDYKGPKYVFYTTNNATTQKKFDPKHLQIESICAQICSDMLTVCNFGTPVIEAAKLLLLEELPGLQIDIRYCDRNKDGQREYHIEIWDNRRKIIFEELGFDDNRYCDLTYINV